MKYEFEPGLTEAEYEKVCPQPRMRPEFWFRTPEDLLPEAPAKRMMAEYWHRRGDNENFDDRSFWVFVYGGELPEAPDEVAAFQSEDNARQAFWQKAREELTRQSVQVEADRYFDRLCPPELLTEALAAEYAERFKHNHLIGPDIDPHLVLRWACRDKSESKMLTISTWAQLAREKPTVCNFLEDCLLADATLDWDMAVRFLGKPRWSRASFQPESGTPLVGAWLAGARSYAHYVERYNNPHAGTVFAGGRVPASMAGSISAEEARLGLEILNCLDWSPPQGVTGGRLQFLPWLEIKLRCFGWSDLPKKFWPPGWAPEGFEPAIDWSKRIAHCAHFGRDLSHELHASELVGADDDRFGELNPEFEPVPSGDFVLDPYPIV